MAHIVLSIVLALLFTVTGGGKVLGVPPSTRQRDLLQVTPQFWRATGALEWAGVVGVVVGIWLPAIGILACIGLALLMVGAVVARLRAARLSATPATGVQSLPVGITSDVLVCVLAIATAVLISLAI
jgi:hypothetical protein